MEGRKKAIQGVEREQVKCQLEKTGWVGEAPCGGGERRLLAAQATERFKHGAQISGVAEQGGRR